MNRLIGKTAIVTGANSGMGMATARALLDEGATVVMLCRSEKRGKEASQKEQSSVPVLQLIVEAMARGVKFLPVDLQKSHAFIFQPEDGGIRMPFSSLPGLGENAAQNIIKAREEEP